MPPAKKVPAKAKAAAPAKKASAPAKGPAAKKAAKASTAVAPASRKAAAKPPAKAAPPLTVTLKQIAAGMAERHDMPRKVIEAVLGDLVTTATGHLKDGDKVRLTGLGILQIRSRGARTGRNPSTGETIQIAASRKIAFRPSKELKEAI